MAISCKGQPKPLTHSPQVVHVFDYDSRYKNHPNARAKAFLEVASALGLPALQVMTGGRGARIFGVQGSGFRVDAQP